MVLLRSPARLPAEAAPPDPTAPPGAVEEVGPAAGAPAPLSGVAARESETWTSLSPPNPASGQSLKTCAETSRTKAAMATAMSVAPDIAPAMYVCAWRIMAYC
jgi:hypothetical protein